MTVAYWILAGLTAAFYLYSGVLKAVRSAEQLRPMMGWVDSVPMTFVRTIGVLEILGAIGLILPPLTGIAPWLAFAAAIAFFLLQIGATTLHLRRGESSVVGLNLVLLVAGALLIWLATIWL